MTRRYEHNQNFVINWIKRYDKLSTYDSELTWIYIEINFIGQYISSINNVIFKHNVSTSYQHIAIWIINLILLNHQLSI